MGHMETGSVTTETNGVDGHTANGVHDTSKEGTNTWEAPNSAALDFRSSSLFPPTVYYLPHPNSTTLT